MGKGKGKGKGQRPIEIESTRCDGEVIHSDQFPCFALSPLYEQRFKKEKELSNPANITPPLFKDLQTYKSNPGLIYELSIKYEFVFELEYQVKWFEKMRKRWSQSPPQTRVDAQLLVYRTLLDVHHGRMPGYDTMLFMSHYDLLDEKDGVPILPRVCIMDKKRAKCGINYRSKERNKPPTKQTIVNPQHVAPALFKTLQDFKTRPNMVTRDLKKIPILRLYAQHHKRWFKNLREKWSESTPGTADEASKLVYAALTTDVSNLVSTYVIKAFLLHYKLPVLTEHLLHNPWRVLHDDYAEPEDKDTTAEAAM